MQTIKFPAKKLIKNSGNYLLILPRLWCSQFKPDEIKVIELSMDEHMNLIIKAPLVKSMDNVEKKGE